MKKSIATIALLVISHPCAAATAPAHSAPGNCKEYVKARDPNVSLDDQSACYCGSQLSNLTVTLPAGLRIAAVCGLHFNCSNAREPGPGHPCGNRGSDAQAAAAAGRLVHQVDLTREKLSLDSYVLGDYPNGLIYLSGTAQATTTGKVTTEEGPAGSLWFNAKVDRRGPVFREHHLKRLSLGTDEHYKKLRAPTLEVTQGACWEAEATIRIRDPVVLLGDGDQAGTGADFDVVRVSEYKPCEVVEGPRDPVSRLTTGLPEDVVALITRVVGCNYYRSDWPYAEETQKKEIAAELSKLNCSGVAKEEDLIRGKYVHNAKVIGAINAAKIVEY
jgi:hypothetical protein